MVEYVLCGVLEDLLESELGMSQRVQPTSTAWRPACPSLEFSEACGHRFVEVLSRLVVCLSQVASEHLNRVVGRQPSVVVCDSEWRRSRHSLHLACCSLEVRSPPERQPLARGLRRAVEMLESDDGASEGVIVVIREAQKVLQNRSQVSNVLAVFG